MVIAHVIDNLKQESGGPTAVVRELAIAQARGRDEVAIICERAANSSDAGREAIRTLADLGVQCIEVGAVDRLRRSPATQRALQRVGPDVVHLHGVWDPIVMAAAEPSARTPSVLSTHGMLHPDAIRSGRFRKWAYLRFHRRSLRSMGLLLALNEAEALHARRLLGLDCVVVPNGIDTETLALVAGRRSSRAAEAGCGAPFILNIGRIHEIKGLDRLIRAFGDFAKGGGVGNLVLAGPDGGARAGLEALAQRLAPAGRIEFHGPAWGSAKHDLLARCAAFVHTPRFEGFGLAVAEALGAGVPTLTTENCHLDGAAEAGALLQVDDTDEAVARGIERILGDIELRHRLSSSGRSWAASNLSWQSVAGKVRSAYSKAGA